MAKTGDYEKAKAALLKGLREAGDGTGDDVVTRLGEFTARLTDVAREYPGGVEMLFMTAPELENLTPEQQTAFKAFQGVFADERKKAARAVGGRVEADRGAGSGDSGRSGAGGQSRTGGGKASGARGGGQAQSGGGKASRDGGKVQSRGGNSSPDSGQTQSRAGKSSRSRDKGQAQLPGFS